MVLGVDICLSTINAWRVIGYLLYIVRILVPLLIIIIATKSFFNVIVKGNLDETKKSFMNLLSKIVIGIIIFMIPSLINTLIVLLSGINFGEGFSMCSICMDSPGGLLCNSYIDKYEQMMNEQINLSDDVKVDGSVDGLDSINKDGMYDSQNTNSNIKGTKNIIIGDSRYVCCYDWVIYWLYLF